MTTAHVNRTTLHHTRLHAPGHPHTSDRQSRQHDSRPCPAKGLRGLAIMASYTPAQERANHSKTSLKQLGSVWRRTQPTSMLHRLRYPGPPSFKQRCSYHRHVYEVFLIVLEEVHKTLAQCMPNNQAGQTPHVLMQSIEHPCQPRRQPAARTTRSPASERHYDSTT